jgi:hypothetical protein
VVSLRELPEKIGEGREKIAFLGPLALEGPGSHHLAVTSQGKGGLRDAGFECEEPGAFHKSILMRQLTMIN